MENPRLSTEEIRAWLARKKPGFVVKAMCRVLCIDKDNLNHFRRRGVYIGAENQRRLSVFIRDWEAGLIEFTGRGVKGEPRELRRRDIPKPQPAVFRVESGRIVIQPRIQPNLRLPTVMNPSVLAKLAGKA